MDLIMQSKHDPLLRIKLLAVCKAAMVEIAGDISHRETDLADAETPRSGGNLVDGSYRSNQSGPASASCSFRSKITRAS